MLRVADSRGRQFDWKEEWGEQMAGISTPRLYVLALPIGLSPSLSADDFCRLAGLCSTSDVLSSPSSWALADTEELTVEEEDEDGADECCEGIGLR